MKISLNFQIVVGTRITVANINTKYSINVASSISSEIVSYLCIFKVSFQYTI